MLFVKKIKIYILQNAELQKMKKKKKGLAWFSNHKYT